MHNIGFRRNLGPQVGLLGVFPLSKYQQTSVTAKDLCILLSFALRNVVVNAESVRFFWDFSVPFLLEIFFSNSNVSSYLQINIFLGA